MDTVSQNIYKVLLIMNSTYNKILCKQIQQVLELYAIYSHNYDIHVKLIHEAFRNVS